jgi:threonylcarbamoyladenosine tRNA methylthiotransferase MtaB
MYYTMTTLGCKVNQYDAAAVRTELERVGFADSRDAVDSAPAPDLVVVATCCVTATAMRKSRQAIRRALRAAPEAAVLVTGCYSDYDGKRIVDVLASLGVGGGRGFVVGHHGDVAGRLREIARRLGGDQGPGAVCGGDSEDATPESIAARRAAAIRRGAPATEGLAAIERFPGHQRAFVKVQDGCDAFCAYCIVPYTRARVWSRPVAEVVAECRALVAAGHREVVLSGVFLGAYGRETAIRRRWDDAPSKLPELVRGVAGVDGLWRVRLSSLEPGDLTDELLTACRDAGNVAPHFHLPLQSGSPRILRRMNRQYTADEFRGTVERLRGALDRPAVTTDIIVGFPSETEEDFAATLDAARQAGFAKIHAFPFSAIEGTAAWTYRDEAPSTDIVKERMAALAQVEADTARVYRGQFVGETMEALVERARSDNGERQAMTDRYLTVRFKGDEGLTGQVVQLHIDAVTDEGLAGRLSD